MKTALILYLTVLVTFIIVDALWLSLMVPKVYSKHLAHLMAERPNFWAASIFYVLYAFGVYFFVLRYGLHDNQSVQTIFLYGFLFGAVAYGTYDLTNAATLKDWPHFITIMDIIWGGFATGFTGIIAVLVARWL